MDEADTLLELRLLMLGGSLERTLEVVEHGQQLVQQPLVRTLGQLRVLAGRPLAVVVEVGRQAEVRVVRSRRGFLRRRLLDQFLAGILDRLLDLLDPLLVGHEVFATSNTSMTSY